MKADGSWTIATLPHAAGATGAIARAVDNQRNGAGNDFPGSTSDAVHWPSTGGFNVLSCAGEAGAASVYGISGDGQTVVGGRSRIQPATAAVWRPGGCRQDLPPLVTGAWSEARAANGDGTIVGGSAARTPSGNGFPVRWRRLGGQWQVQQLDQRRGLVYGANGTGDLAGLVRVSCSVAGGCQRAIIWYANGGSRVLGTALAWLPALTSVALLERWYGWSSERPAHELASAYPDSRSNSNRQQCAGKVFGQHEQASANRYLAPRIGYSEVVDHEARGDSFSGSTRAARSRQPEWVWSTSFRYASWTRSVVSRVWSGHSRRSTRWAIQRSSS